MIKIFSYEVMIENEDQKIEEYFTREPELWIGFSFIKIEAALLREEPILFCLAENIKQN